MNLASMNGRIEVARADPRYPPRLTRLEQPPERLFVRGDPAALSRPGLAVIGTRHPTPYGIATTELAARMAVAAGATVISGGAIGCDQAAGREALRCGGRHVMVLGSGADVVYPASSRDLVDDTLAGGGAVISIVPWGAPPRRFQFPQRNRIIAALAEGLFIGEAGMPSGTFSTAETAMDIGIDVLVAPGSIFSSESRGTNYLLELGACCIADEEALDAALSRILGYLRTEHRDAPRRRVLDERQECIVRALVASPLRSDEIARLAGFDARSCLEFLSTMVIEGLIEQLVDGRYAATKETLHARTAFGHNGSGFANG